MSLKQFIKSSKEQNWALGFVRGGLVAVMESNQWEIDWVKMLKDRWFADPFVLDVTEDEILLLVEDFGYDIHKGVISLLHINRATMEVTSRKVLLEKNFHMSFPAIWRKDGHIYVYPESAHGGRLDMYEYHPDTESLSFTQTICDDVVWDSYITEAFGEPMMFTAAHDDHHLDIYKWNEKKDRFVSWQNVISEKPNMRMGGGVFFYNNSAYYPAQNCEKTYGGAIDIKRIDDIAKMIDESHLDSANSEQRFSVETVKHIESPHPKMKIGIHTLNEYKGVVVIDVKGYRFGKLGALMEKLIRKFSKR